MQVGGSGTVKSEINVTPLVDVVLVLLIIFMVITPVVQMGYMVRVPPKPKDQVVVPNPDQIILRLLPNNRIMINKEDVPVEQYPQRIREILKGNTGKMVFFAGDEEVSYEETIKFLDMTKASGAPNIGIIVEDLQ
jgi:biopolymer transport protein TolR